jgi:3-dehydroquinate synthase class II
MIQFRAATRNTGPVTFNGRVLMLVNQNGKPLRAGDLEPGDEVVVTIRDLKRRGWTVDQIATLRDLTAEKS